MPLPVPLTATLLPELCLAIASIAPERPFARVLRPPSRALSQAGPEIARVTWARLLGDSKRVAHHLVCYGPPRLAAAELRCVGVLAGSGYAYFVHLVACWLVGWTPVLISPSNSIGATEHLLRTSCTTYILHDQPHAELVHALKGSLPKIGLIPMADIPWPGCKLARDAEITAAEFRRPEPSKEFVRVEMDSVAFYLHTSGSTGSPKLVPFTHAHTLSGARGATLDRYCWVDVYAPVPIFHGMGAYVAIIWPLSSSVIPTFISFQTPPTIESVIRDLEALHALPPWISSTHAAENPASEQRAKRAEANTILFTPPSFLTDLARGDEPLDTCKTLARLTRRVIYSGAGLDHETGDMLVGQGVNLCGCFGTTETSLISTMDLPDPECPEDLIHDWPYVQFNYSNYTLHLIAIDEYGSGLKRLVISPGPQATPAVINHTNPSGFATEDLWQPHPTKHGLWQHVGRKDDVIVLSSGGKVDKRLMEAMLLADPNVSRALVFGTGRFFVGVLLQPSRKRPASDQLPASDFVAAVWPTVENMNANLPKYAKVLREMVLVASEEKPLLMTAKETLRVKETEDLYSAEIEAAYRRVEDDGNMKQEGASDEATQKLGDLTASKIFIRRILGQAVGCALRDEDDIFDKGLDSLDAIKLRRDLVKALPPARSGTWHIPHNLIYEYPSISRLAEYLSSTISGGEGNKDKPPSDDRSGMRAMIKKYTNDFPSARRLTPEDIPRETTVDQATVLITGSTGSLGSHLLASLIIRQDVAKVYCLNRHSDMNILDRHAVKFTEAGLDFQLLVELSKVGRVQFATMDLSANDLHLEPGLYAKLQQEVTHIVHLAWQLNFNFILDNFERTHIAGIRNLIDFALTAPSAPRFVFLSSIGAVAKYGPHSTVPETQLSDPSIPSDNGYGQSKFVAEQIISEAAAVANLKATVVRAAQLSGSRRTGAWSRTEHIPIMLKSSLALGMLPILSNPVRWTPVDIAADIIADVTLNKTSPPSTRYFHLQNPDTTSWDFVADAVYKASDGAVRGVPIHEWIAEVNRVAGDCDEEREKVPAVRLLTSYQDLLEGPNGLAPLDITESMKMCPRLGSGPISNAQLGRYLNYIRLR